jgi:hypothetical protein
LSRAEADLWQNLAIEGYTTDAPAEEVLAAVRRAVSLRRSAGSVIALGESLRWLSRISWWAGDPDGAAAAGDEAVEVLAGADAGDRLAREVYDHGRQRQPRSRDRQRRPKSINLSHRRPSPPRAEDRRTDRGRAHLAALAADAAHEALERQAQGARRKPSGKLAQRLECLSIWLIFNRFIHLYRVDPNLHPNPQSAKVDSLALQGGGEFGQALPNDGGDGASVRGDQRIGAGRHPDVNALCQEARQAAAHDGGHRGLAGESLLPVGQRGVRGYDA